VPRESEPSNEKAQPQPVSRGNVLLRVNQESIASEPERFRLLCCSEVLGHRVCLSLGILLNPCFWIGSQILASLRAEMSDDVALCECALSLDDAVES